MGDSGKQLTRVAFDINTSITLGGSGSCQASRGHGQDSNNLGKLHVDFGWNCSVVLSSVYRNTQMVDI